VGGVHGHPVSVGGVYGHSVSVGGIHGHLVSVGGVHGHSVSVMGIQCQWVVFMGIQCQWVVLSFSLSLSELPPDFRFIEASLLFVDSATLLLGGDVFLPIGMES
jgi:hypothetical protein